MGPAHWLVGTCVKLIRVKCLFQCVYRLEKKSCDQSDRCIAHLRPEAPSLIKKRTSQRVASLPNESHLSLELNSSPQIMWWGSERIPPCGTNLVSHRQMIFVQVSFTFCAFYRMHLAQWSARMSVDHLCDLEQTLTKNQYPSKHSQMFAAE